MICPVCQANNCKDPNLERCVQCGVDLEVHKLLAKIKEGVQMKPENLLNQEHQGKLSKILFITQVIPSILLLICSLFGIFVGFKFIGWLEQKDLNYKFNLIHSEMNGMELQQVISIIEKELNLIIEQKKENQDLRLKVNELTIKVDSLTRSKEEANELPKN
jgi:hypothetical protein